MRKLSVWIIAPSPLQPHKGQSDDCPKSCAVNIRCHISHYGKGCIAGNAAAQLANGGRDRDLTCDRFQGVLSESVNCRG
jgi:hypothetical protein